VSQRHLRALICLSPMRFSEPQLIQLMRSVLEEVIAKVPVERSTPAIKAYLAEYLLKAAAQGQTSHDGPLNAAARTRFTSFCRFSRDPIRNAIEHRGVSFRELRLDEPPQGGLQCGLGPI
jgi:hypothetical protein